MSELSELKIEIGALVRLLATEAEDTKQDILALQDYVADNLVSIHNSVEVLHGLVEDLTAALAELDKFTAEPVVTPPVVTPPVVTPPVVTPPVVTPPVVTPPVVVPPVLPPPTPANWRPDLTGLACASRVPLDKLPAFRTLTEADCHWIIRSNGAGSTAVSTRGLAPIAFNNGRVAGLCYRASRQAGHTGKIVFGVYDNAGLAVSGGKWGATDPHSICMPGETNVDVGFIGLSDSAEVGLGWSRQLGFNPEHTYVQNIGIRGQQDSMVLRATEGAGTIIFNGFWLLGYPGQQHEQGIHIDRYHTLVLKGQRWRGKTPSDPGLKVAEHMNYLKRSVGGAVFLIDIDGRGGNRTGVMQVRPGQDEDGTTVPSGPIVVLDCTSAGYGWTHGSTPETSGGGAAITVWSSPNDPVFILRNRVTDARYAALMVGGQGYSPFAGMTNVDRNWYGTRGYPIDTVVVEGNHFENTRGDRPTVSLSNIAQVDFYKNNTFGAGSQLVLDNGWSMVASVPTRSTAKRNGQVNFIGGLPSNVLIKRGVNPGSNAEAPMTTTELDALIRPASAVKL